MRADLSQNALRRIWDYNVFPLIEEQLWGDQDAIGRWRWEQVRARYGRILAGKAPQEETGHEEPAGDDQPARLTHRSSWPSTTAPSSSWAPARRTGCGARRRRGHGPA